MSDSDLRMSKIELNSKDSTMKIKKYSTPSGFLLLLALPLISILSSCQDNAEAGAAREVPVREYPVIEIQTMDVRNENKYPATIEGVENIGIRAKVDGYIQAIYVDEGEYVRRSEERRVGKDSETQR